MPNPSELALVVALAITQALDWYSTRRILGKGGIEENPVAKWFMDRMTVDGFLGAKAVAVTGIGYWLSGPYTALLVLLVVFYAGVLAYNWKSL